MLIPNSWFIPPCYLFLLVTIRLFLKLVFLGYHLLLLLFHFFCLFGSSLFCLIARKEIEPVLDKQKTACKQKSRTRWLHWGILPNTQRIYLSFSNYSKRWKRRQHSQSHSMKPPAPYTKTRRRHYKKKRLQVNIFDEIRCKNLQQNISKLNPTRHKKDHTPWSSWIHPRVTSLLQHMQINQCDTPH